MFFSRRRKDWPKLTYTSKLKPHARTHLIAIFFNVLDGRRESKGTYECCAAGAEQEQNTCDSDLHGVLYYWVWLTGLRKVAHALSLSNLFAFSRATFSMLAIINGILGNSEIQIVSGKRGGMHAKWRIHSSFGSEISLWLLWMSLAQST